MDWLPQLLLLHAVSLHKLIVWHLRFAFILYPNVLSSVHSNMIIVCVVG